MDYSYCPGINGKDKIKRESRFTHQSRIISLALAGFAFANTAGYFPVTLNFYPVTENVPSSLTIAPLIGTCKMC
jgi:hypothetical protein